MKPTIDQEVRDAASTELDTSFFLEAGAGTGKTKILVRRVLEIIRLGRAAIDQVVVITFTEKAAGELRSRIRGELHAALAAAAGDEATRYRDALDALDVAHVETIHSLAGRVLREHPLHARIDPNYRQLSEVDDELDFQQRWLTWLWEMDGEAFAAVERCRILDMPLETVREIARRLAAYRELEQARAVPPEPDARAVLSALRDALAGLGSALASCMTDRDGAAGSYRKTQEALQPALAAPEAELEGTLMAVRLKPPFSGGKASWKDPLEQARLVDGLTAIMASLDAYHDAVRQQAVARLVRALAGFVRGAAEDRRREGSLNFADLLIETRALLLEHASVRRGLQERFRFILVDEFQDTDPLQAEIVFLLGADERGDDKPGKPDWRAVTLAPGKLFLVGDPKQSIYRFRRADIEAYAVAREIFERHEGAGLPAQVRRIVQNFRSLPEVVDWVNAVFSKEITVHPDYPHAQPAYDPIAAHRELGHAPRVIHLYPAEDQALNKIDAVRKSEADAIARLISQIVLEGWPIGDRLPDGSEHVRPARPRDVCLLIENRTKIALYTDALTKRGIPFILDGGKEFFQRQEVRDVAALLRALDDPSDRVSLVAALKSQAFSCSDEELLQFRVNGGALSIFSPPIDGDPVSAAIAHLLRLYGEKSHHGLAAFVDRVIRETFLVEALLLTPDGRQRAANLKLIVDRAAEFASGEADALRPFIRWISERQGEGGRETESQVNESDDDVVRITTVHSAKGLEFPVVILAKLASGEWKERRLEVVDREAARLEFELGTEWLRFRTPGFARAWEKEEVYADAEQRRLMYVAATRACDYLVVPVYAPDASRGHLRYFGALPDWHRVVGANPRPSFAGARVVVDDEIPDGRLESAPATTVPDDLEERWEARTMQRRQSIADGPRFVVPSGLVADEIKEPRETEPKDRSEDERDLGVAGDGDQAMGMAAGAAGLAFVGSSAARQRGSLVHDVLYRCDLADPESAERWAERLCGERGAPELRESVAAHARAIITSPAMERVLRSPRVLREVPVAWFDGTAYVEGFVDLAFEEPDGWVVLDYKTDRLGDAAALSTHYAPQIAAYRSALEAAGVPVKETGLWFTADGSVHLRSEPIRS